MTKPLLAALRRQPLPRPPVWVMRQAGRYLPEYREIRERHGFNEVASTPELAAEVTLQPIRRFGMDGAVIFADIMTPLQGMGVEIEFDPGPELAPLTLAEVTRLPDFDPDRVEYVAGAIRRVREEVPDEVAVIGFAGAPVTLLAYLLEGGGSKEFLAMRSALRSDPIAAEAGLGRLAEAMAGYLRLQVEAGAEVVQLFDTWGGLLDRERFTRFAVPSARRSLAGVDVPTIYFAPGAGHVLEEQVAVGADGYGVDWRTPIDQAWGRLGEAAVQGNLDPAVLLADRETVVAETEAILARVGGRPGHVFNLGHGIDRHTPPDNVAAMVETVRR